jgi:hypothetical protein
VLSQTVHFCVDELEFFVADVLSVHALLMLLYTCKRSRELFFVVGTLLISIVPVGAGRQTEAEIAQQANLLLNATDGVRTYASKGVSKNLLTCRMTAAPFSQKPSPQSSQPTRLKTQLAPQSDVKKSGSGFARNRPFSSPAYLCTKSTIPRGQVACASNAPAPSLPHCWHPLVKQRKNS